MTTCPHSSSIAFRSRSDSSGGATLAWECTERLLSQRGLALIATLTFGQKKQTKWERALQSSK